MEKFISTLRFSGKDMGEIEVYDLNGNGPFAYEVDHVHFHTKSEHTFAS